MNPYAPPQAYPPAPYYAQPGQGMFQAWIEGDALHVQNEAPLPDCCMKCGSTAIAVRRNQLFAWTPQWVYLFFLVSGLIAIVLALVLQKKGRLQVPLCANCAQRWSQGMLFFWLAIAWLVLGMVLGGVVIANDLPELGIPLFASAFIGLIVVAVMNRARFLRAKKIDDRIITLTLVHPMAAQAIVAASQGR
ncbi:MAG: hypothetical protein ACXVEE_28070 [Polyangiales bacterium]